jgi:hypothetical protein
MRIHIVGTSGAGKTTLAAQLAQQLGIKQVILDDYRFGPNWVERPKEQFMPEMQAALQPDADWVSCGNYRLLQDYMATHADYIIWLDYPFWLICWRVLQRSLRRIIDKQPICNNNIETWRRFFSKKSIVLWVFQSHGRNKQRYKELALQPQLKHKFIRISFPGKLNEILHQQTLIFKSPNKTIQASSK